MSDQEQQNVKPFTEDFWREDGGRAWVASIDALETSIEPLSRLVLERSAPRRGELVLDVGCGGGTTSIDIAGMVGDDGRVIAVDVSPPILAVARERGGHITNLEFVISDAGVDDLGEDLFDLVFSRFGVMFFADPPAAFANLRRALKPEGRFVFVCWRTFEENPWMSEPAAAVFEVLPPPQVKPPPDAPGPFSLAERERIESLLQTAGYSDIGVEAVDVEMPLGSLDEALATLLRMGPAAKAIADAGEHQKPAALEALEKVLRRYETSAGIVAPGAGWIITAGK